MRFRYHSLSECTMTMAPTEGETYSTVQYIQYIRYMQLYMTTDKNSSSRYSRTVGPMYITKQKKKKTRGW